MGKALGRGKKKVANRTSRRSTTYPCYLPVLGEFSRSWPCRFAIAKVLKNVSLARLRRQKINDDSQKITVP